MRYVGLRFSTIQYNTTVKLVVNGTKIFCGFSTIQYNTTVKHNARAGRSVLRFSTIQYNTTVKPVPGSMLG